MFPRQPFPGYSPYAPSSQGFSQQMPMSQQSPAGQQLQPQNPQPQHQYFIENQAPTQTQYYTTAQPSPSPAIAYRSPQQYSTVAYTTPLTVYTPYYTYPSQTPKIGTIYPSEIGGGQVILQQAPQTPQPQAQPQPQPQTIQPQLMQPHQGEPIYASYQLPNQEGVQIPQQYLSYSVSQPPRPTQTITPAITTTPNPTQMGIPQNPNMDSSYAQQIGMKRQVQQMPMQPQPQIPTQQAQRSQPMMTQQPQASDIHFEPMDLSNSSKPQVFSQQEPPGWFDIIGRGNLPSLYFTTEVSLS